ncbi:MAG: hypothetical protein ACXACG_05695 [Candidatus Thorarchaeota archaeon]|jgi:hypothetical protein
MTKLEVISKIPFKEVITSVELVDLSGDGKSNLVITTLGGDAIVYDVERDANPHVTEIGRVSGLPPLAAIGIGDVIGNGTPDFVIGGLDNILRVLVHMDGELSVKATTPLGALPTAVVVLNVLSDDRSEVVVATTDGNLRCYGWYDIALDKLAHKVVERPIFSIQPLHSKGLPYSRFIFGDDSGHLFVYQYADDRLHERAKISTEGEVSLVASGDMTSDGNSEIMTVSDGRKLSLFGIVKGSLEKHDSVKAPKPVTAIKIGKFWDNGDGQIISSHSNSTITVLGFVGKRIIEDTSLKTSRKSTESHLAIGDINGDSRPELVQAVGTDLYLIDVLDE